MNECEEESDAISDVFLDLCLVGFLGRRSSTNHSISRATFNPPHPLGLTLSVPEVPLYPMLLRTLPHSNIDKRHLHGWLYRPRPVLA